MLVALPIEALLMGAKSGHPAFNLFANGAPGNRWLPRCRRDFNRRFEFFKFDHGRRGGATCVSASGFFPVTDCTNAIVCAIKRSRSITHFITHLTRQQSQQKAADELSRFFAYEACAGERLAFTPSDHRRAEQECDKQARKRHFPGKGADSRERLSRPPAIRDKR